MRRSRKAELKLTPVLRGEIVRIVDERIREAHVARENFTELKWIVRDLSIKMGELAEAQKSLAEMQKRTEARFEELAEAQKRTESRLEELAEAQKKTETRLEELAEAQKRTEARLEELAEAQKNLAEAQRRTEARVEELAAAQKNTETELQKLIVEHRETRKQLGGLSVTVGFTLENAAYKGLPELLKRDFGIELEGSLKRKYVSVGKDKHIEVNIIGEGRRDGRRLMIVGECKSQFSKNDVDDFIRRKLRLLEGVFEEIFPLAVVHMISEPDAEDYARSKGIAVYYSYEL